MNKWISILILTAVVGVTSCQREISTLTGSYQLKLTFKDKVDSSDMQLGSTYHNPFNESYTLTMFKYYVSNISLHTKGGNIITLPAAYHLVDEADLSSKSFIINLDEPQFSGISFLLGVDSARNVSGTQMGDLDPAKGMFWTWNSGYVMAKIEANSPLAATPNNKMELHIGGFKTGENVTRMVLLNLPDANPVDIKSNGVSEVIIQANANAWFKGVHDLKIADNPVCTTPGALAQQFADNYAGMFKVVSVIN